RPPLQLDPGLGRTMVILGVVLSVVFGTASQFDYFFSPTVPFQLTLGGLTLLVSSVLLSVGARWHPVAQLAFVVAVVGVAAVTVFTAYGRLNLVTLGLVGVVLVSHAARAAWLKPLVVAAVGPALLL